MPGEGVRQRWSTAAVWALAAVLFGALLAAGGGIAQAAGSPGSPGSPGGLPGGTGTGAGTGGLPGGTGSGSTGTSGGASAPSAPGGGTNIGPAQINALGRPDLCWQANGNGGPITLESCDFALQAQQWSLTSNGVLMNGIGYCLEARTGTPSGTPLYIDFAGQCGGGPGQVWQFSGATGQLSSSGICAVAHGALAPGTEIVRRGCPAAAGGALPADRKWSLGYSAVSVQAGRGGGAAGLFSSYVTVANAASAETAYGVAVTFGLPRGLAARGLHVTGGAAGWTCRTTTLTCTGSLLAGSSGRVEIAGSLPASAHPGGSYPVSARVSVAGTSPAPGPARTTALVDVAVTAAAAGNAVPGAPAAGAPASPGLPLVAIIAGVLVAGGGLLVVVTRRPRAHGRRGQRRRPGTRRARRGPARQSQGDAAAPVPPPARAGSGHRLH